MEATLARRYLCSAAHCMHSNYEIVPAADYDALVAEFRKLKEARELGAQASATMRDESIAKSERIAQLEAALRELLDSMQAPYPPFEAGRAAQEAWSDRCAKARNDADFLLSSALETIVKPREELEGQSEAEVKTK